MSYLKEFFAYLKNAPTIVQVIAVIVIGIVCYFLLRLNRSSNGSATKPEKPAATSASPNSTVQVNLNNQVIANGTSTVGEYAGGRPQSPTEPGPAIQRGPDNEDARIQQDAGNWHNLHRNEDNPPVVPIFPTHFGPGKKVPANAPVVITYRYFHDSDGCLDIVRSENGKKLEKWVVNPQPAHKLHAEASNNLPPPPNESPDQVREAFLQKSLEDAFGKVQSLLPSTTVFAAGQNATPIQVPTGPQYCINPHGGGYKWAWGPVNGCMQPQYRNFDDGCQHYQLYNVCAGVWDPQIYWTFCRAHPGQY
jgi:hypothetical protein